MDFILSTDSTCDLSKEQLKEMDVYSRDMLYYVDGEEYGKNAENQLEFHEFYEKMRGGASTSTSMINEETAREFLTELYAHGKNILHLAFAGPASGTCENFKRVADELNATGEHKIYVVDSLCYSGGEGLFVTLVDEKRRSGATFEETCAYAEEVKHRCMHYFVVDDLKYLARGGRLSKGSAFLGTMLNIKPVLHVDENGYLVPIKKVFGRKKSLKTLVDKFDERYNKESDTVYLCHGDCLEDAQYVADEIGRKYGLCVKILPLSYVIGSHSGPGTVALFFTGNDRTEK